MIEVTIYNQGIDEDTGELADYYWKDQHTLQVEVFCERDVKQSMRKGL